MDLRQRLKDASRSLSGEAMGTLLWGSFLTGDQTPRSDIDVCVVAGPAADPEEVQRAAWRAIPSELAGHDVDIKVFEDLPRFLQGAVIEDHEVLWSPDEPALYEHLYPFRRLWEHEAHRHRLTKEEARQLVRGGA